VPTSRNEAVLGLHKKERDVARRQESPDESSETFLLHIVNIRRMLADVRTTLKAQSSENKSQDPLIMSCLSTFTKFPEQDSGAQEFSLRHKL